MSEHESKSGGNSSVVIIVAVLVLLLLIVPCGLAVLGAGFFLLRGELRPQEMHQEFGPVEVAPVQTIEEPLPVLERAEDAVEPPLESTPN